MIKIGIIGLGEVAQLMHLPILADMHNKYEIRAIADISPSLNSFIAEKYNVPKSYLSPVDLIKDPEVEAVFVLSPDQYHYDHIVEAIHQCKHVFVEKPVTLNIEQLGALIELEAKYPDQIVMVGYMRRFEGSFLKAKEFMEKSHKQTEYIRFRDIICEGPFFIGQTRSVFLPKDIPGELIKKSGVKRRVQLNVAIGADATTEQRTAYEKLTGLGCHSFSAVREIFGMPKRLKAVVSSQGGEHLVVVLEYEGFLGTYELVNNQDIVQFDAAIEIYQKNRKLKINYETPYVRHQASTLEVTDSSENETQTSVYGPDYNDAFATELHEFHNCVTYNSKPKTTLVDSLDDLKLFKNIIECMGRGL